MSRMLKFKTKIVLYAALFFSIMLFVVTDKSFSAFAETTAVPEVSVTAQGDDLLVQFSESVETNQLWILRETEVYGGKSKRIWSLALMQLDGLSFLVKDRLECQIDGNYYFIIKKQESIDFTSIYFTVPVNDTQAGVLETRINNKLASEYNYLNIGEVATITMAVSNMTQSVILTDSLGFVASVQVTNGVAVFENYLPEGDCKLTITAQGADALNVTSTIYNIRALRFLNDYSIIKSVKVGGVVPSENVKMGSEAEFEVEVQTFGDVNHEIMIKSNNLKASQNLLDFSSKGYGIYQFTVSLVENGVVYDTYTGYYNYARPETKIDITIPEPQKDGDLYTLTASATGIANPKFMFVRWDAAGQNAITGWTDGIVSLNIKLPGVYRFEVRVKGNDAGSFEARKYYDIVVGDVVDIVEKSINIYDINLEATEEVNAYNPYIVTIDNDSDAVLYKFIITTLGQWNIKENYSADNSFVWVPEKPGEYKIEVWVLKDGRYGFNDKAYTKQVSVTRKYDDYTSKIDTTANWVSFIDNWGNNSHDTTYVDGVYKVGSLVNRDHYYQGTGLRLTNFDRGGYNTLVFDLYAGEGSTVDFSFGYWKDKEKLFWIKAGQLKGELSDTPVKYAIYEINGNNKGSQISYTTGKWIRIEYSLFDYINDTDANSLIIGNPVAGTQFEIKNIFLTNSVIPTINTTGNWVSFIDNWGDNRNEVTLTEGVYTVKSIVNRDHYYQGTGLRLTKFDYTNYNTLVFDLYAGAGSVVDFGFGFWKEKESLFWMKTPSLTGEIAKNSSSYKVYEIVGSEKGSEISYTTGKWIRIEYSLTNFKNDSDANSLIIGNPVAGTEFKITNIQLKNS